MQVQTVDLGSDSGQVRTEDLGRSSSGGVRKEAEKEQKANQGCLVKAGYC